MQKAETRIISKRFVLTILTIILPVMSLSVCLWYANLSCEISSPFLSSNDVPAQKWEDLILNNNGMLPCRLSWSVRGKLKATHQLPSLPPPTPHTHTPTHTLKHTPSHTHHERRDTTRHWIDFCGEQPEIDKCITTREVTALCAGDLRDLLQPSLWQYGENGKAMTNPLKNCIKLTTCEPTMSA